MQSEGYSTWSLCVCVSVSLSCRRWLTDSDQLFGYIDKLCRQTGGAAQCPRLCSLVTNNNDPLHSDIVQTKEMIGGWKATLKEEKIKLHKRRLQELFSESLSLGEVTVLLDCRVLWARFNNICIAAERNDSIVTNSLDRCAVALAGRLLFKHSPGTV